MNSRTWYLPVLHPAHTFYDQAKLGPLSAHLEGFVARLLHGLPAKPRLHINPTVKNLRWLLAECRRHKVPLAVDIETGKFGLLPKYAQLTAIGVGADIDEGIGFSWSAPLKPAVERLLKKALADPTLPKVAMNAYHYDWPILSRYGFTLRGRVDDIKQRRRALSSTSRLGLGPQASYYCLAPPWKAAAALEDEMKGLFTAASTPKRQRTLLRYNAEDCVRTAQVDSGQRRDLEADPDDRERIERIYSQQRRLAVVASEMSFKGFPVDARERRRLATTLRSLGLERAKELRALVRPFERKRGAFRTNKNGSNLNDLRALLFKECARPGLKSFELAVPEEDACRTDSGLPSTDKTALLYLYAQPSTPNEARAIIKQHWRAASPWKALGTFVQSSQIDAAIGPDGRLHAGFNSDGTETGRWSCIRRGTPVEVLRDVSRFPKGVPIEDVRVGDMAYCYDDAGVLRLRRVLTVMPRGRKPLVRIHWRGSGHQHRGYVDVTADHQIKCTDGTWKAAGDLLPGDSVFALSRGTDREGYQRLYPTGAPMIAREHRFIAKELELFQYWGVTAAHIHHVDGNKGNNVPLNLQGMTAHEHLSHHGQRASPELRARRSQMMRERRAAGWKPVPPHLQLSLTKTDVLQLLERFNWSVTRASREGGIDFDTLKKYARHFEIDLAAMKHQVIRRKYGSLQPGGKSKRHNHEVLSVEHLGLIDDVFDLEIEEHHNFIAGELCVHNCTAPNLYNLPEKQSEDEGSLRGDLPNIRSMYVAPRGYVIVHRDMAQFEVHVMAEYSGDKALREAVASGDVHTARARQWFNVPTGDVPKGIRKRAKTGGLAFQYGMGARTAYIKFLEQIQDIPFDEVLLLHTGFPKWHPGIKHLWESSVAFAETHGYSEAPIMGWRRYVPPNTPCKPTETSNYPIQGAAAAIMNCVLVGQTEADYERALYRQLKKRFPSAWLACFLYDALDVICRKEDAPAVAELMESCMRGPWNVRERPYIYPSDLKIGGRWSEV